MAKWHYVDEKGNVSSNAYDKEGLRGLLKAKTVSAGTRVVAEVAEGSKSAGKIGAAVGGTAGGLGAGAVTTAAIPSIIGANAVAGTAGAAATSSGLAALGGGSVPAGGLGVAGGTLVVAALPIAAAAAGAAALGFCGYKLMKRWKKSAQDKNNQETTLTVGYVLGIE